MRIDHQFWAKVLTVYSPTYSIFCLLFQYITPTIKATKATLPKTLPRAIGNYYRKEYCARPAAPDLMHHAPAS